MTADTHAFDFLPGLELSRILFEEAVRPLLAEHWPGLAYSAALLGTGSEVLGYDTAQSMDHSWGPRLLLFLTESDLAAHGRTIDAHLRRDLPRSIRGVPTDLAIRRADPLPADPTTNHAVMLHTVDALLRRRLGFVPQLPLGPAEWLAIPEQILLSLTAGQVFHDGLGQLEPLRTYLHYYPRDVWLYLLAAQWARIGQEEAFVGRCGQTGDELGSAVVAARLVRDVMRLCFLMERRFAPYSKWLGTAFLRLDCGPQLAPDLRAVLRAETWREREQRLTVVYEAIARRHNALGLTPPLPDEVSPFHERPFVVIHGDRFADALRDQITDPEVLALPPGRGGVDQFIDSTPLLSDMDLLRQTLA